MVKIERGTANTVILTITGTLSKSETKFTGRFSGILSHEMELKNYSLNNVVFDETGGAKWNAEKKTIALPLRSSAHPDLKQFSLVFHSETETLATGNYPISENGEAGTVSLAKAYFANAPVYINCTLGPSEIGYKTGSIKVEVSPETNEYTLTIDARDSYDIIYQENASAQVVYGSTLTGSFQGSIGEQGGGEDPEEPQYNVWQDTYSNTPAVVSYGLTSDLEGYERSYIGRIDLQPDTEGEANMRLFFINRAPDASAAGFDPTQIEFIPGYSYATLGQDLDDPIFPYVLMEGDLNLSYDSGSQKWTLHYEGFFVAPLGHKIKVIADYVGPMDGFTAL